MSQEAWIAEIEPDVPAGVALIEEETSVIEIAPAFETFVVEIAESAESFSGPTLAREFEEFTASNAQVAYTLLHTPQPGAMVFINGLLQSPSEYALNPTQLLFDSGDGILAGDKIGIFYFY